MPGAAYHALGDYPEAARVLGLTWRRCRGLQSGRFGLAVNVLGISRYHLVLCFWRTGRISAGGRARGQTRFAGQSAQYERLLPATRLACLHLARGEWRDALDAAPAASLTESASSRSMSRIFSRPRLCHGVAGRGRWDPSYEQAVEQADRMGYRPTRRVESLGWPRPTPDDQPDEAAQLGERALVLARRFKERGTSLGLAPARRPRGWRQTPRRATAEANYGQALVLAAELRMRPLVAHCHLGLGKLYRRTGDGAKAHEHLTTASAMYREMDMAFWLAQSEAAQREVELSDRQAQ